jgi:GNAT superfamily N-acetyltransferase
LPTSTTPTEISAAVRELAENPGAYGPVPPRFERIVEDGYCVFLGPMQEMAMVQRIRLRAAEVAGALEQVRALARERKRPRVTWWIGDSAAPPELEEQLSALGLTRSAMPLYEPTYAALALVRPPAGSSAGVVARRVESYEEFLAASEIAHEAFGQTEEQRESFRHAAPMLYELGRQGVSGTYLAFVHGQPVASATAVFADAAVMLLGGATLPEARGQGCYRALVETRWRDGVERGTPALVVQAGQMSRPILERLGFELVSQLHVLVDELA